MTIAILATGDEITHGDTLNTTSQVFASALSQAGFSMGMHLVCGDKPSEIMSALRFLTVAHQTLIITGGLGPTSDDRTRFVLSEYLDEPLVSYPEALASIQARLEKAGLEMGAGQACQADFPKGATLFPNPYGTAYGCALHDKRHTFLLLPGPPKECLPMFETYALDYLKQVLTVSEKVCLKWLFKRVSEGHTAERVEQALSGIPCDIGYRLMKPDLEVKVRCKAEQVEVVKKAMGQLSAIHLS